MKLSKPIQLNYKSIVLYGDNGTGKTRLASTLPGKKLIVDVNENGSSSVLQEEIENIDIANLETVSDLVEVVKLLESGQYDSVVFDTMTQIGLLFQLQKNKKMSFAELDEMKKVMIRFFQKVESLDLHKCYIFQAKEENKKIDEETSVFIKNSLDFYGSFKKYVIDNASIIMKLEKRNIKKKDNDKVVEKTIYIANGNASATEIIKVRGLENNTLSKVIQNPTWNKIINTIKETKGEI